MDVKSLKTLTVPTNPLLIGTWEVSFTELLKDMGVPKPSGLPHRLSRQYQDAKRGHHGYGHLVYTWNDVIQNCIELGITKDEEIFAVLSGEAFHDCILVPGGSDNEARSAVSLAIEYEELGVPRPIIDEGVRVVLLTAKHEFDKDDLIGCAMLDADLGILSADWPIYVRYAAGTMFEYVQPNGPATLEQYIAGRTAFLSGMIERPQIFSGLLPHFNDAQARANMRGELKLLATMQRTSSTDMVELSFGIGPVFV